MRSDIYRINNYTRSAAMERKSYEFFAEISPRQPWKRNRKWILPGATFLLTVVAVATKWIMSGLANSWCIKMLKKDLKIPEFLP